MKRFLLGMGLVLTAYFSSAQVLFLETFDNIPGPTAGGAGTYSFAPGFLLRNVDNLTPDAQVAYVNDAWERREDFVTSNTIDSCAFSTSWYSPVGIANDFMWTPAVTIPASGTVNLTWNGLAPDALYPDGYEVRVMVAPNIPTGGAGIIGNQITNSSVVFSTVAEASTWTSHTVSLNAYLGQTIYIGFRNNSNNMFLLMIDDIKVESIISFDASVTAGLASEYTSMPVSQALIPLGGTINNLGASALTNVSLVANVYNSLNVLVHTATSAPLASLAAGANQSFVLPPYSPTVSDVYTVRYNHVQTEVDPITANDEFVASANVHPTLYSRDDGVIVGGLGIGAGNGGYLGNSFTLTAPAYLYSIEAAYTVGYTGEPHACVVWNTTGAGVPNSIIASTDTLTYPSTAPLTVSYPIYGGNTLLPAGTYVVTAIEFDSTLQVAQMNTIFTPGKMWVNWPTTPLGGWGNVEAFGAAFSRTSGIRLNLGSTLFPLASQLTLQGKSEASQNVLNWNSNENAQAPYSYSLEHSQNMSSWREVYSVQSAGSGKNANFQFVHNQPNSGKNFYRIRATDPEGKVYFSNTLALLNGKDGFQFDVYPNPAKGQATILATQFKGITFRLMDMTGKVVLQKELEESATSISLNTMPAGIYQMAYSNSTEVLFQDKLVIE